MRQATHGKGPFLVGKAYWTTIEFVPGSLYLHEGKFPCRTGACVVSDLSLRLGWTFRKRERMGALRNVASVSITADGRDIDGNALRS